MTRGSKALRWVELALWALGISLLGGALAATTNRWSYQAQQERVLFEAARPVPAEVRAAEVETKLPRREVSEVPVVTVTESFGPAAPRREPREPAVDPNAFGRIEIPRLGLTAIIREGADEETLDRAVGLVPGAARPGEEGNIVLAGHRDTFFRPLRRIRVDDRIRVVVPPHEYEYRVDSLRVVAPEETSVLQSKGFEELTLVTCYPFRFIGPAPDRFIVSATRVD